METPVNAVYGKNEVPQPDKPIMVFGRAVTSKTFYTGLIATSALVLTIILVLLPSGLPFLAAKNAGGFFGYIGLFFLYMLGFLALVVLAVLALSFFLP